jgi:hypothetical protein
MHPLQLTVKTVAIALRSELNDVVLCESCS